MTAAYLLLVHYAHGHRQLLLVGAARRNPEQAIDAAVRIWPHLAAERIGVAIEPVTVPYGALDVLPPMAGGAS